MYNKLIVVLMLLTISVTCFSQKKTKILEDTILWNADYQLTKDDFKAVAKKGYAGYAVTIIYLYTKETDGEMQFVVEALFSKSKSALAINSEYGIKHERGHFDICEIYARKLRQRMLKKNFMKVKNIKSEINEMYNQINTELKEAQDKYDQQTEHSMNMAQQKSWEDKISKDLHLLDEYSSTEVDIVNK